MDKTQKKHIKKITSWVLLAALVAGLAAMPLLAKAEAEADGPVATVHSGTVETGSIRTSLRGGGTLATKDIEDVIIPSGVKITEFLVKNGDTVSAGTPLAAVDKVSVMTAITAVTETMEYLQEEMKDAKDEKVSSTITATAGGRIKKVFAEKGDSIQDVMLRDGALALLSLDGLMAVKIQEKLDILTGDTVTVTLSDGTETTGRIASNLDGVVVITVEDEGYAIGEAVTITGKDGSTIGSGELYVHNAWKATAFSGTVQTVRAKEETKVSAGSTLFTLTDTDFQGTLEYLASLHREYEQLMQDLFKMYNSGTIDAPCDGTIAGIDKESTHLLSADGEQALQAELLTSQTAGSEKGWSVVLLSNVVYDTPVTTCDPTLGEDCPETNPELHKPECLKACQKSTTCAATGPHYSDCLLSCTHADHPDDCGGTKYHHSDCIKSCVSAAAEGDCTSRKHNLSCIQSCISSDGTRDCPATGKHKTGCIESCTHADTADKCPASLHHYTDCIKACITSDSGSKFCPASKHNDNCFFAAMTYKAKVAIVTGVGSTALVVRWDASGQEYDVENTGSGWKFSGNPNFSTDLLVKAGDDVTVSNPKAYKAGDVIFVITGYKGTNPEWSGVAVYTSIPTSGGSQGGMPGMGSMDISGLLSSMGGMSGLGSLSGFGISGFTAVSPVEEEVLFDLEGSVLMTVSPETRIGLTITLDEQDIAKVTLGQKAMIRVEALGDEQFEAVVTEIANHGVNSGGTSKFSVNLELPKSADMLDGMSATASLPLQEKENILTIPVMALAEQGAQTVVYTGLDEETGEPSDPVPVTIGISDGTNAEILSGLEEGDTYYYSYYDVVELDTGVEDRFTMR